MMFGTIVVSGLQMIGKCGYSQRNITIIALSLSVRTELRSRCISCGCYFKSGAASEYGGLIRCEKV